MSFSFSFSGDDIEADDSVPVTAPATSGPGAGPSTPASASAFPVQGKPQLPPQRHDLQEMLAQLPSKIAFGLLDVTLDGHTTGSAGTSKTCVLRLPRRELWDVRVQLMAEDDGEDAASGDLDGSTAELAPGLGSHDVKTGIYEGGFKSWESSVDLVKVLLQPQVQDNSAGGGRLATPTPSAALAPVLLQDGPTHVIELGCGTALPSLALFQWACACATLSKVAGVPGTAPSSDSGRAGGGEKHSSTSESAIRGAKRSPLSITVADYNPSVLYLVTLPNFLLAWAFQLRNSEAVLQQALTVDDEDEIEDEEPRTRTAGATIGGELELTDDVKKAFCDFLVSSGITLSFLSGGWSPALTELLFPSGSDASDASEQAAGEASKEVSKESKEVPGGTTLVLGAETIYSPFALEAFSETTLEILRRRQKRQGAAMAIVGAKKLYFGVGGSLDDFVVRMRSAGATVRELREETDGVRRGVVQCLLE